MDCVEAFSHSSNVELHDIILCEHEWKVGLGVNVNAHNLEASAMVPHRSASSAAEQVKYLQIILQKL
jgi:hypothetical protein